MKVLFISSGRAGRPGNVVKNQGDSLIKAGVDIGYFLIKPGFWGYLNAIGKLRNVFKNGHYDLAHAHYSLCGFVAGLSGCKPLVVSLMGSDIYISGFSRSLIRFFIRNKWTETIVKTQHMKELIGLNSIHVIPNGVDIERFKPIPKEIARQYIGYTENKKLIIFVAAKNREEKNLDLALKVINRLNNNDIDFKHIYEMPNQEIPYYLNAADVLLLTSKREGSVNVVKEALACNCRIVATDVGDISWILDKTNCCQITSFDSNDIVIKLVSVLNCEKEANGRHRIIELGLDSFTKAREIIEVYGATISTT